MQGFTGEILYLLLFGAAISSGSAFGAARFGKKYEEMLPLTCMGAALFLFLFGLCGALNLGFYLLLAVCAALWAAGLLRLVRRGQGEARRRFFTPNFFLFAALFCYLWLLHRGRLAASFDELSHWADVVKAMTQAGVLNSNPLANSDFQSYPPGIALFQFFAQRLGLLCAPADGFRDWRLYHAFHVLALSLVLPFLRDLNYRRLYAWPVALACFLAPGFLFPTFFVTLLVDPMLGLLTAAGLAAVLLNRERDGCCRAFVLLCIALLTLTKTIGVFFALVVALGYALSERPGRGWKSLRPFLGVPAALLPWLLWKLSVRLNAASVAFPDRIDYRLLLRVLLGGEAGYRTTVRNNFLIGINELESSGRLLGIVLSYPVLTLLLLSFLLFAGKRLARQEPERARLFKRLWILSAAMLPLYLFGLLVMYLFKFGEYEALRLASFQRYMAIPLLALWMEGIFITAALFRSGSFDKSLASALLLLAVFAVTPSSVLIHLTNRSSVAQSQEARAPYDAVAETFAAHYDGPPARVYLVSQSPSEYEFFLFKYSFRPQRIASPLGWIVDAEDFGTENWPPKCSPEQLYEELFENCDFLLLHTPDESFLEHCSSFFSDSGDIRPDSVYRVNRETGLLDWYC